jgi:hypothetical protein
MSEATRSSRRTRAFDGAGVTERGAICSHTRASTPRKFVEPTQVSPTVRSIV